MQLRRDILKIIGGGVVGTLLTPLPWKLLYDAAYWTQNWSWIPRLKNPYGLNEYIPTLSKTCPSGVGILCRTVEGRPVQSVGNPKNALSQGAITALASTETQLACSPSRVKKPMKKAANGTYTETTWEDAMAIFTEKFKEANSEIALLSGDKTSSINDLFTALLSQFDAKNCFFMPCDEQNAQKAWTNMGGAGRIGYAIKDADFIFSIGANYLENWGAVVYNRKDYSAKRPTNGKKSLTLAYAGSAQTNTAACADYSLFAKVNSEYAIALGIANILLSSGRTSHLKGFAEFAEFAKAYTPEKVESISGIPAQKFKEVVQALLKAEKPLIIVGSETDNSSIGVLPLMAGIACNLLLGTTFTHAAGELRSLPFPVMAFKESMPYENMLANNFIAYTESVLSEKVKAPKLFITYEANPLYALPKNVKVDTFLEKAGFTVAFASFMNETAMQSDLILPLSMGFESFDDIYTPYGCGGENYSVGQMAAAPNYNTKTGSDIVLDLAKKVGKPFEIGNAAELVATKAEALNADMDSLLEGETFISKKELSLHTMYFNTEILAKVSEIKVEQSEKMVVVTNAVRAIGTAVTGIPPFSTKLLTNDQLIGKYMVAQINKKTAKRLNFSQDNLIKIKSEYGDVQALVSIYEGVADNTFLLPYGLGHTAFDAFSQNKGDNIINLTGVIQEAGTGAYVLAPMYVTAEKV